MQHQVSEKPPKRKPPEKKPQEKRPLGRPTKYKPEYCQELVDFMAKGFSFEAFAGKVKVSNQTIYDWLDQHPDFLEAKHQAFAASRLFWEGAAVQGLWQDKNGPTLNNYVWGRTMQNRFGYTEKGDQKINVSIEPVRPKPPEPREVLEEIKKLDAVLDEDDES